MIKNKVLFVIVVIFILVFVHIFALSMSIEIENGRRLLCGETKHGGAIFCGVLFLLLSIILTVAAMGSTENILNRFIIAFISMLVFMICGLIAIVANLNLLVIYGYCAAVVIIIGIVVGFFFVCAYISNHLSAELSNFSMVGFLRKVLDKLEKKS